MRSLALALLAFTVFLTAFEDMLVIESAGTVARLAGILGLGFGLAAVLELRRVRVPWALLWMAIFVASAAASLFYTIDPERTVARTWTYVQLAMLAWLVVQLVDEERDVRLLLAAYVLGAWMAALGTLYAFARGFEVFNGRFAAPGFNPNDLAYILALGIPAACYLRARGRGLSWLAYAAYPLAAVAAVLLTASRGGLFAAAVGVAYVAFTTRPLRLVAVTACLGIVGLAFSDFTVGFHDGLGRFATIHDELVGGTLNQRTIIWSAGLAAFLEAPGFGSGAGAFSTAVSWRLGAEYAPHNAWLAILVDQGLLGLIAFLGVFAAVGRGVVRLPLPERRLWAVTALILALALLLANWEWRKQTWILLALALGHEATLEYPRRRTASPWTLRGQRESE